jgi:hypothetical protein
MFLARVVFFRLHESPRYLVHAGRHREALENLQLISVFNGRKLELNLQDVDDGRAPLPSASYHPEMVDEDVDSTRPNIDVSEHVSNYHTNGEASANNLEPESTSTPNPPDEHFSSSESPRPRSLRRPSTTSAYRNPGNVGGPLRCLPRWLRRPFHGWYDRVMVLLGPEWFRTTLLIWAVWAGLSLGKIFFLLCGLLLMVSLFLLHSIHDV